MSLKEKLLALNNKHGVEKTVLYDQQRGKVQFLIEGAVTRAEEFMTVAAARGEQSCQFHCGSVGSPPTELAHVFSEELYAALKRRHPDLWIALNRDEIQIRWDPQADPKTAPVHGLPLL